MASAAKQQPSASTSATMCMHTRPVHKKDDQSSRDWFSAPELAGLIGVPGTVRGIRLRASNENWSSRSRGNGGAGRGNGSEYHINSLPVETRAALRMRERRKPQPALELVAESHTTRARAAVQNAPVEERDAAFWASWERKPKGHRDIAQSRLEAVHAVNALLEGGTPKLVAYEAVATARGESVSSIRGYMRLVKDQHPGNWLPLLTPRWTGRTAYAEYDARIYQWFRDLYLNLSRPPATLCYERTSEIAAKEGLTMPSYDTLMRDLNRREDPVVLVLERDGAAKAREMFPYLQRLRSGYRPMEALNADGHNLDIAAVWPDGEECRATLIAFQDLYSGAIVGWTLAKSESAYSLGLAFLDVCDRHGVCDHLYVDNTMAMASKKMTAGATGRKRFRDQEGDPLGVMPALGVKVHFTNVRSGQSKPVERAHRDVADRVSKHPAFTGAYLGNSTVSKPANYGTRRVPVEEIRRIVEQEILRHNAQHGRRTEVCAGKLSFQQAFEDGMADHGGSVKRLTATQRRMLYMMSDRVTVDKRDGCVKLFGNRYWSDALLKYRGSQVILRYHPVERTLHDCVHAYGLNGDYIGEVPCYHAAGFADAGAAEQHNRARRQFVRAKKQLAEAGRHLDASEVAALVPDIAPPSALVIPDGAAVRLDFTQPSSNLDRIATILPGTERGQEASQARVTESLAKLTDAFERQLRAG